MLIFLNIVKKGKAELRVESDMLYLYTISLLISH